MANGGDLEFIDRLDSRSGQQNSSIQSGPQQGNGAVSLLRQSNHPVAAFFHYVFKTLAILVYVFGGFFSSNFVLICVTCILLLSFDFWTVKNISGRLMVGLRWWSNVLEDGTTSWVYESLDNPQSVHGADSKLFWLGLYATPVVWSLLFVIGVLKFNVQWLIIDIISLLLSAANITGYHRCSKDANNKAKSFMQDGMARAGMAAMGNAGVRNMVMSSILGGSNQQQGQGQQQQHGGTGAMV